MGPKRFWDFKEMGPWFAKVLFENGVQGKVCRHTVSFSQTAAASKQVYVHVDAGLYRQGLFRDIERA